MAPVNDAEVRAAFVSLYDECRRLLAGASVEEVLRVEVQRHEALWRRLKTEKPKRREASSEPAPVRQEVRPGLYEIERPETPPPAEA